MTPLVVVPAALALCTCAAHAQLSVAARGGFPLPSSALDQFGASFNITGLSGITYAGPGNADEHRFLAVMDNSRFVVELAARISPNGSVSDSRVIAGLRLAESRDFEGIALSPTPGRVLLSEEGTPGVREYDLATGALANTWTTPSPFAARRDNFGFESLARLADTAWTCNEEALTTDGPPSSPGAGSLVRLLRFTHDSPDLQLAYRTEPIHGFAISGSRSGVSDLVLLPGGAVLSLERSLALAAPLFLTRIFEIDAANATDVSHLPALVGASFTPVTKRLLYSGGHDNLEGLCLGPRLAEGSFCLLGVVDDADSVSTNELVAFELSGVVECRADWDRSGAIDSADFFAFLTAFFADDADFNADSVTDSRDFFAFLSAWFAGC